MGKPISQETALKLLAACEAIYIWDDMLRRTNLDRRSIADALDLCRDAIAEAKGE